MNRGIYIILVLLIVGNTQSSEAQLFDKIKNKINKKIENTVDEKADEVLNGKKNKKKNKGVTTSEEPSEKAEKEQSTNTKNESNRRPLNTPSAVSDSNPEIWNKYDFLAADTIFYYDDQKFEEYGEFPTRWDLAFGNSEVARLGTEKVIQLKKSNTGTGIYPLIEKEDYIEGYTTIEFDVYLDEEFYDNIHTDYEFGFYDISKLTNIYDDDYLDGDGIERNNFKEGGKVELAFMNGGIEVSMGGKYGGRIPKEAVLNPIGWHHIAMSFNKTSFKFYLNEHKMINAPKITFNPFKFYIYADVRDGSVMAVKNIKIASGGGSVYKQISTAGRFVTNGISFDRGKSSIQPQSYGVIKKLAETMMDNPEWKFTIIGHTDNDGDEASNLILSKKRAESVKNALVAKGITAERLLVEGKGESIPLNSNTSPMDKATNRRVEFLKQ